MRKRPSGFKISSIRAVLSKDKYTIIGLGTFIAYVTLFSGYEGEPAVVPLPWYLYWLVGLVVITIVMICIYKQY